MATDGVSLYFNPEFVETLSSAELIGTLAHEVMHPALQHHTRRAGRSPKRWNMACVYAINPMLLDAGLTLPKDVLMDHRFRGMSAEEIYNLLEAEENNSSQDQDGDAGDQGENVQAGKNPAAVIRIRILRRSPRRQAVSDRCSMLRRINWMALRLRSRRASGRWRFSRRRT
jgi:predicted metal-dependent peptidase